jgi:hypothetical protein
MTVEQAETIRVVITDASVLINLTHTGHIPLLGCTPGYRFLVSCQRRLKTTAFLPTMTTFKSARSAGTRYPLYTSL